MSSQKARSTDAAQKPYPLHPNDNKHQAKDSRPTKADEFEINIEIRHVKAKGSFEKYGLSFDDVGTATFVSVSAGSAAAVELTKQNRNVEDGLKLLRVDGKDVTGKLTAVAVALPDVHQDSTAKMLKLVCTKDPETYYYAERGERPRSRKKGCKSRA